MQLGSVMGIAAGGMRLEANRLAGSAQRVAEESVRDYAAVDRVSLGSAAQPAAVSGYGPGGAAVSSANEQAGPGKVDMATEQVTQLSSLRAFQANVAVLRTADDMLGSLISQRG